MKRILPKSKSWHLAKAWVMRERDRVYIASDPDEELGTVVKLGDEQSLVEWDEGVTQIEINTKLRRARVQYRRT